MDREEVLMPRSGFLGENVAVVGTNVYKLKKKGRTRNVLCMQIERAISRERVWQEMQEICHSNIQFYMK